MNIWQCMAERYSCRSFTDEKLTDETLMTLLEAAQLAPTARNEQPQRIYVLDSAESLAKIAQSRRGFFNEPCVLLFTYDKTASWKRNWSDNYDSGTIDVTIALTQLVLAATEAGLGSCIILAFEPDIVRREFNIPDNEEIIMQLSLGYPSESAAPAPRHYERNTPAINRL